MKDFHGVLMGSPYYPEEGYEVGDSITFDLSPETNLQADIKKILEFKHGRLILELKNCNYDIDLVLVQNAKYGIYEYIMLDTTKLTARQIDMWYNQTKGREWKQPPKSLMETHFEKWAAEE